MRVSLEAIKDMCSEQGLTLTELLEQAGVSRNAFYSLAREASILPRSIKAIAESLHVSPLEFLTEDSPEVEKMKRLLNKVDEIAKANKGIDRDNVRHTLLLMDESPIESLRRALTRGQQSNIYRK